MSSPARSLLSKALSLSSYFAPELSVPFMRAEQEMKEQGKMTQAWVLSPGPGWPLPGASHPAWAWASVLLQRSVPLALGHMWASGPDIPLSSWPLVWASMLCVHLILTRAVVSLWVSSPLPLTHPHKLSDLNNTSSQPYSSEGKNSEMGFMGLKISGRLCPFWRFLGEPVSLPSPASTPSLLAPFCHVKSLPPS